MKPDTPSPLRADLRRAAETPGVSKPLCVDLRRAADMLGVSTWTVRAFVHDGKLPAVRFPAVRGPETTNRRILIAVSDLEAFVAQSRETHP